MMRRVGPVVAAVALSMTGLAACSGGDEAYCGKLDDARSVLDVESSMDDLEAVSEQFAKAKGQVEEISSVAPEEVKEQWTAMSEGIDEMSPALKEFEKIGDPAELSPEEQAELLQKVDMQAVQDSSTKVMEAGQAIDKDSEERCGEQSK